MGAQFRVLRRARLPIVPVVKESLPPRAVRPVDLRCPGGPMPSIFVFPFVSPLVRAGALAIAGRRAVARHALAVVLGLTAVAGSSGAALAQAAADPSADLGPLTQRWLDDAMSRNQASGLPLRMEVSVGSLDSRVRLGPRARGGPHPPPGGPAGGGGGENGMEGLPAGDRQGIWPGLGADRPGGSGDGADRQ